MRVMSLKHVDIEAGLRRLADCRIEDAMKEGKFDNLAGMGRPLDLDDMPAEENARTMWWMLRILRHNDFTPDEVQWRKAIDRLRAQLAEVRDETKLRGIVEQINHFIKKLNTMGTNALKCDFAIVDVDGELAKLRSRTAKRP